MKWIALVTLVVATSASAQDSTTNCTQIGNTVSCNTSQNRGLDWTRLLSQPNQSSLDPTVMAMAMQVQAQRNAEKMARLDAMRSDIATRIQAGDCDGAKRMAQFYGNKRLLKDTLRACQ